MAENKNKSQGRSGESGSEKEFSTPAAQAGHKGGLHSGGKFVEGGQRQKDVEAGEGTEVPAQETGHRGGEASSGKFTQGGGREKDSQSGRGSSSGSRGSEKGGS